MNSLRHLSVTVIFILFLGLNGESQQNASSTYTDYDYGLYFFWTAKKYDSAYFMFNRYVKTGKDRLKKGSAYKYIGELLWTAGDLYGAQENLLKAIDTLNPGDEAHRVEIGYAYNILGNVSVDLKLYHEALGFYDKAIGFHRKTDYGAEIMNGKAIAYQKMGKYDQAIAIFDSILRFNPSNKRLVARMIDNAANTKWLQNPRYPALPEFWKALKIRLDSQYHGGLNASYAHLSDYYSKVNRDSALWYAQRMLAKAKQNQSPEDVLEAIDKLIRLSADPGVTVRWYGEYKRIQDSLQRSRDTTRNRFAVIRYNFQKAETDNIALQYDVQKNKADNLLLQQHITKQRVVMYGLIATAIIFIVLLWIWYDKRRKRIRQESEIAMRDARLKTSQKVHDVVANGLYGIMNELEHGKAIEKEHLMTRIENLYERSRDISYEEAGIYDGEAYNRQIHKLLTAFADDQTKLILVGNQASFWEKVTAAQKHELQLVLNELMVNMKKHSRASNVVVVFKQQNIMGLINYKDDGVGLSENPEFGNGLNNTVNRIKSLNGEIIFGKSEQGGLSISISFPLQPVKT